MVGFEGFVEDAGETFAIGTDDGMVGIVAKAGHEDDGGVFGMGGGEDLVAIGLGEFDVGDDQIVLATVDESEGFATVGGGIGKAATILDDVGNGLADKLFVVHNENFFTGHFFGHGPGGFTLGADNAFGTGLHIANGVFDGGDIVNDDLKSVSQVVVTDVVFHEHGGVGGDAAERFGQLTGEVVGGLSGGLKAFDDEEVQDVEGDGDIASKDFGDLAIIFGKGIFAVTFDVKCADDFVVQLEGNRKATTGAVEAGYIVGIVFRLVTDVTASGGRDEPGDAVALTIGEEIDLFVFGHIDAEEDLQFVGRVIEDSDNEMVEFEQIFGVADDFVLNKTNALLNGFAHECVGFQSGEFPSGFVDGVESLLEASAGGGLPNDGGNMGEFGLRIEHRSGDHFEIPIGFGFGDGISSRSQEVVEVGRIEVDSAKAFLKVQAGVLAVSGDILLDDVAEVFQLSIGPEDIAVGGDGTDAFADGIEYGAGLLIDGSAFEGQEIGGYGEDGAEIVVLKLIQGFIHVVGGDDLGVLGEEFEQVIGLGVLSVEDQDFALANL